MIEGARALRGGTNWLPYFLAQALSPLKPNRNVHQYLANRLGQKISLRAGGTSRWHKRVYGD
jgi:hypothetical protein